MTNREEFEAWWGGTPQDYHLDLTIEQRLDMWVWEAWQACTALHEAEIVTKDKEIAELLKVIADNASYYVQRKYELELDNKKLLDLLSDADCYMNGQSPDWTNRYLKFLSTKESE
jgi:hypothetical protein